MGIHILAIDDDPDFLTLLRIGLKDFTISVAETIAQGMVALKEGSIDLVLLDISIGKENGLNLIETVKEISPTSDVVMVTGHKDPALMVEAVRRGASDYLIKPFAIEEVIAVVEKLAPYRDIREKHSAFLEELNEAGGESFIIGRSEFLLGQLEKARKMRGQRANVLIEGESGTGKELFARYVHRLDQKACRPFVAINCAAIPDNLLESELFGYEKGAFTGATERKIGKFELATGGDLFLDEVSSLKMDLQAKILRAIQEQEIVRIGGMQPIKVNFRVIASSNENLEELVRHDRFRRDLFHRLRVVTLTIPPLRERKEDIPILAEAFLKKHATSAGWSFNRTAMMALQQYPWPGNVRELENLIQSLVILVPGPVITVSELPKWMFDEPQGNVKGFNSSEFRPHGRNTKESMLVEFPESLGQFLPLKEYMTKMERAYVARALELGKGDKSKAAAVLQVSRTRLYDRLRIWGMTE